ncbi:LamG domain-containing protein [Mangrovivirga cuniculi]|uniref:LamG-like jellyroll fold domain-containing protein n=1 Tax=Mangrovivirga cuniculi TaxID=2715131 RepID=A0A4D7JFZ2_9BACT|nr:LamG domain-containing protein [Mangrovivirga cuniculi]QCK14541.1 hypothetical protein DCC35_07185 [Mangrovivirga cuniculi]
MRFNKLSQGLLALVFISVFSIITSCDNGGEEPVEPEVKDIPRDGLVAFYPFNGNANDESEIGVAANGVVGKSNGEDNAILVEDRFGNPNSAYQMNGDGIGIYIDLPEKLVVQDDLTVSCWVKDCTIGEVYEGSQYTLRYEKNGPGFTPSIFTKDASPGFVYYYDEMVNSGWLMVTFTWDNTEQELKLYYNDNLVSTSSHDGIFENESTSSALSIGDGGGNGTYYDGKVDDLIIYHKKLSEDEITAIYNQTITK